MTCPAALALVTGGYGNGQSVEIYSSDGSCNRQLSDLPDNRYAHTVNYVDGYILLCGGDQKDTRTSCLVMNEDFTMVPHSTTIVEEWDHSSVVVGGQLTLLGGGYSLSTSTEFVSPSLSSMWTMGYTLLDETRYACA